MAKYNTNYEATVKRYMHAQRYNIHSTKKFLKKNSTDTAAATPNPIHIIPNNEESYDDVPRKNTVPVIPTSSSPSFFFHHTKKHQLVPEWDKGSIIYFVIFNDRALGSNLHFLKPEKIWKGKIHVFRPTHGSGLSRYRVMISSKGVLLRQTRSLVSHTRQLKVPFY